MAEKLTRRSAIAAMSGALTVVGGAVTGCAPTKNKQLVWYSPTPEGGMVKVLAAFQAKYPWVNVSNYLCQQSGKVYQKIVEEIRQGLSSCDVLSVADIGLVLDFQRRGYWQPYLSKEHAAFADPYKSKPPGLWAAMALEYAGISWNRTALEAASAPKSWLDLLNPRWGDGEIVLKDAASGMQYAHYLAMNRIYGPSFWNRMARQRPIFVSGQLQQYERVLNGESQINGSATSSGYTLLKKQSAPLDITYPSEGVPSVGIYTGIVKNAPNPEVARLFIDFLFSLEGQKLLVDVLGDYSARPGAGDPLFAVPRDQIVAADLGDLDRYLDGQKAWRAMWSRMAGSSL